jgi:hypothetical protein
MKFGLAGRRHRRQATFPRSGGVTEIALRHPPTPLDVRFSASSGWIRQTLEGGPQVLMARLHQILVHRLLWKGPQRVRLATAASAPLRLHRFWLWRARGGDRSCHAPRPRVTRLAPQFLPRLRSLILRPFAPVTFATLFATTASADCSQVLTQELSPGKVAVSFPSRRPALPDAS